MAMTRDVIVRKVRAYAGEPDDLRFIENNPEVNDWIDDSLKSLSRKLKFIKDTTTFLGSAYTASLGTSPRYYQLSSDMVSIDKNRGVEINGLRRWPTTEREFDGFQNIAQAEYSDTLIYVSDYNFENLNGIQNHYEVDYVWTDEIDGSRSGKLISFDPNPADTDTIIISYIKVHPALTSDASTIYLPDTFYDLICFDVLRRIFMKVVSSGDPRGAEPYMLYDGKYEKELMEAKEYFTDISKTPDKKPRIKTARQKFNMYNSRSYANARRNNDRG